jgi:hypothetical protein
MDSLPLRQDNFCCQILLSLQVWAVSAKSPVVMKANPRELLDINSISSLRGNRDIQMSSKKRIPEWIQLNGIHGLINEHATALG